MQQHDRQRAHKGVDVAANMVVAATTTYSDGASLQDVIADIDDRVDAAGGGGGGGGGDASLVTGDNSVFATGIGDWTGTGGTISWDNTRQINPGGTGFGSLKWVTTAVDQTLELTVPDLESGEDYLAVFWFSIDDTDDLDRGFSIEVGEDGVSSATGHLGFNGTTGYPFVGAGKFLAAAVPFHAQADCSPAKVIFSMENFSTADMTFYMARFLLLKTATVPTILVGAKAYTPVLVGSPTRMHIGPHDNPYYAGITAGLGGDVSINNQDGTVGLSISYDLSTVPLTETFLYYYAEHTPGDKVQEGHLVEVGTDYVGFYLGQKSSSGTLEDGRSVDGVIQWYADYGDYDFEFADGAVGRWRFRSDIDGFAVPSMGMLPVYASAPHAGVETEGESYYDSTLHAPRWWNGTVWKTFTGS